MGWACGGAVDGRPEQLCWTGLTGCRGGGLVVVVGNKVALSWCITSVTAWQSLGLGGGPSTIHASTPGSQLWFGPQSHPHITYDVKGTQEWSIHESCEPGRRRAVCRGNTAARIGRPAS